MSSNQPHAPGTFCWPELVTTDQEGAERFYAGLFGWEVTHFPMGPAAHYTIFQIGGRDCAAAYPRNSGQVGQEIPPHWQSYVAVADVDRSAARAAELGGAVLVPPFDVMEMGRSAVIADPTGAVFSLWQAKSHPGVGVRDAVGALTWSELVTRDPARAAAFYMALLPWSARAMPLEGSEYTVFTREESPVAGMMAMGPDFGDTPPHWMPYFQVTDCDAASARAVGLGATVLHPSSDVPGVGRFCILRDPQGAAFTVMRFESPA
jgi:hypothetical protein